LKWSGNKAEKRKAKDAAMADLDKFPGSPVERERRVSTAEVARAGSVGIPMNSREASTAASAERATISLRTA